MNTETSNPFSDPAEDAGKPADEPTGDNLLGTLQADLERFRDVALRSQADFENYRKRAAREKDDAVRYANAALLEKLIPVIDNFELGMQAAKGAPEGSAIIAGLEMVARQLQDFLTQHGVEAVPAEGQKFDPNLHEAFAQEASDTLPEGQVVRQLRKGFRLRDRLLRPAAVVVSKGPAA